MDNMIFIIGAARSGTTLLAKEIFASDNRFCYTGEVDFLWRYGAGYRAGDLRRDASDRHLSYIRSWMSEFAEANGGKIVVDKTPSNCLRVPLLRKAFPDAKVIHIVRDGRAVAFSAREEWTAVGKYSLDSADFRKSSKLNQLRDLWVRRLRLRDRLRNFYSFIELGAELPKAYRSISRIVSPGRQRLWGPRFPGVRELMREMTALEVCALQWEFCVKQAHSDCLKQFPINYHLLRFEDLIATPEKCIDELYEFLGIASPKTVKTLEQVKISDRPDSWRQHLNRDEIDQLNLILGPQLAQFGYRSAK
ncbi:sulfotransferase [Candidatus Marimicrobium litorale]|uniref:Sulfotransferase n=1 Tax=Candidatus Marimicrobium litorale TaxID=2518991 RepID=A0ABT3T551_9GAMM|nr:sulfotransferase [Candidatus Marimicrobium litorale]MCX2977394.1 hypothetical protein [Candidatus Marimicrobium litorale]